MPILKEALGVPEFNAESLAAYENARVLAAVQNSEWFKAYYLDNVNFNVKAPKMDDKGKFKSPVLTDFLRIPRADILKDEKFSLYIALIEFLRRNLVDEQGNLYTINSLPFFDYIQYVKSGAIEAVLEDKPIPKYRVDRAMSARIEPMLQCIIAPESIKKQVVKLFCSWQEKDYKRGDEVALWAEVVRSGAAWYVKQYVSQKSESE